MRKGFTLIEVFVAMTIFAIAAIAVMNISLDTIDRDARRDFDTEAYLYAQEGLEAVRNMRDRSFFNLSDGDHGLSLTSNGWVFIAAPERIDDFYERTITIESVYRDENGNIAETGTFDAETKKVTASVTWTWRNITERSVSLETYLTDWSGDDVITTTCTEFNAGVFTDALAAETPAPPADNCAVALDLVEDASSFFASADIGDHGNDVVIEGNYAYVANNKTQTGFTVVDITDPEHPAVVTSLDIGGKGRAIYKSGNYVYVGVEKSSKGLAIIDVTNPTAPELESTLNVGAEGNQAAVSGNYLFIGVEKSSAGFVVVDITSKTAPIVKTTLNVGDDVHAVVVSGNYAYIGTDDDDLGFQIVSIQTPLSPTVVGSLDVEEEVDAIALQGIFAFIGTEEDDEAGFQVINIATPSQPTFVTDLDVGGEVQDVSIAGDYAYAAVDSENGGLAAINIVDSLNPYLSYTLDIQGKGEGIAADTNYIYIAIDTGNKGLVIIGTTVAGVASTGTFTSSVGDTGSTDTRYNYIEWDYTPVPGSTVQLQVKTASTEAGLASATWVGSDGTNATYYTTSRTQIVVDPSASGVRYFQFKVFIASDGVSTPQIETVRMNYTP